MTILKIFAIGIGATLLVDLWSYVLGLFNIKSLDYRYVGRWILNFPNGKFFHKNIMTTTPIEGEILTGWLAHYSIGVSFAFLLFFLYGKNWLDNPMILPAIIVGTVTVIAPLFIMQPAFGFGIASTNLSNPHFRILKSVITHFVYGNGLFLTALLVKQFWN
ncbi:MAG: DUF2938 domain-containing protein [Ignavibacteriales bacterium]|nr:MAG: DUF2938 domain-containing protein [Ignavibacteriales bacterium]